MKHWREHDGRIHCEEAGGGGYTLCGAALEGERGDQHMTDTAATINCRECVGIIEFCKRVRGGEYVTTMRDRR